MLYHAPFITQEEATCNCGSCSYDPTLLGPEICRIFYEYRSFVGRPISILRSYSCPAYDRKLRERLRQRLGLTDDDQRFKGTGVHTNGIALDLKCPAQYNFDKFYRAGAIFVPRQGGMGPNRRARTLHIDTGILPNGVKLQPFRTWSYTKNAA